MNDVGTPSGRLATGFDVVVRHRRISFGLLVVLLVAGVAAWGVDPVAAASIAALGVGVGSSPRHLGETPSYAHGLPGLPNGPPRPGRLSSRTYVAVNVVALVAAVVLVIVDVVVDAPRIAYLTLAVVAIGAWLIAAESAIRLARHRRRMRRALEAYAPTIAMAFAGRSGAPWQLRMWEPYLVRSGEPCVVINLHPKYTHMILDDGELTSPLITLGSRETAELNTVLVPSLRALFYVQNAQRNVEFMSYDRLTHVSTGMPVTASSLIPKSL